MSKITNDWPTSSPEAEKYRKNLANSGRKSALNAVEFEKRGIPYEDVYRSTSRLLAKGNAQNFLANMEDKNDLRQLAKQMTVPLGREAFGMEILENTKECFAMDMHYCPHLQGWLNLGLSDEMCAKLCDLAMEGDYAMAEEMGFDFENPSRLARGDATCRVIYRLRQTADSKQEETNEE